MWNELYWTAGDGCKYRSHSPSIHPASHPFTHHMFHLAASFLEVSLMDLSTAGARPNLLFMGIEWNMSQYWALSGFTSVHVVSCSYRLHYAYTSIAAACATRQTGLNLAVYDFYSSHFQSSRELCRFSDHVYTTISKWYLNHKGLKGGSPKRKIARGHYIDLFTCLYVYYLTFLYFICLFNTIV